MAVRVASENFARLAPSFKVIIELPKQYVPLRSDTLPPLDVNFTSQLEKERKSSAPVKNKSFKLHVGGNLSIPTPDAKARPAYSHPEAATTPQMHDPFEGLPFRNFAERMGEKIMPTLSAAREDQRRTMRDNRLAAETAEPIVPTVPHVLPFTRWVANSQSMRSTFVAEAPASRKKARLSWYHPDDTMVPRDWLHGGLLADLKYYNPFNLLGSSATSNTSATTA